MAIEKYFDNRLFLFGGHYGSGKSEIAVNFAIDIAQSHKTAIVDFDIINPYFRTASAKSVLTQMGVHVIAPIFANTNVEIPALPAEISSIFDNKQIKAVFDVGGDSAGAKAVSRYHQEFISERAENFFVFNLRRPMTSSVESILNSFYDIQETARLPFTSLINNTNLLSYTNESDLLEGLDAALELSERLSIPIAFSALMRNNPQNSSAYKFPIMKAEDLDCAEFSCLFDRSAALGLPIFYLSKFIKMDY